PLLPIGDAPPRYAPTEGTGSVEGLVHVEDERVWGSAQVLLEGVATSQTPPVARVEGGFDWTPWAVENLRLTVRDPPRSGSEDATLAIGGRIPWGGVASLEFDAMRVPMRYVRPWFELPLHLEGDVTGRLEMRTAPEVDNGRLIAILAPATIADVLPADGLQVEMSWRDDGRVTFDRLDLLSDAGILDASGTLERATGALDLTLGSPRLALDAAPLASYLPREDLKGYLALEGSIGGTLEEPRIGLEATVEKLRLGGRTLDAADTRLELRWADRELRAAAFLNDILELRGGGRADRQRSDLGFAVEANDLAALADLLGGLPGPATGGRLGGRLQISGPLTEPRGRLLIESLDVEVGNRRLSGAGTPSLLFDLDGWRISGLSLREEATASELTLDGVGGWSLTEGGAGGERQTALDLSLLASLNADWVALAASDLAVGGRVELEARVAGSLETPRVTGLGRWTRGSLKIPGFEQGFTDLEGLVRFEGDEMEIEEVSGDFASGEARLSGLVSLDDGAYRLELQGRGLDIPYLGGWSLGGNVDLALRSLGDGHLLAGSARLDRLEYLEDIRFDLATMVRDALRGQRLQVEPAGGLRSSVELEVQVQAPGAVRLRNNLADLRGDADFALRGNLAQPVIFGEIEMRPGGVIEYNETEYELERGRLIFADPFRLTPEVDLVATTRVRDIDVTLALSGPLERLDTRFSSEPPLPDVEVFRLLAGGDASFIDEDADLVAERTAQLGEERGRSAASFLYGQAASVIGQRVNSLFRFDRFRIDPLTGSADNLSKARVTVGKRLSKDVFVTYSVDPSTTDSQRVQIEWQVADGLVLVLTADGDDSYSADARWETSF
ncbi:MAG: translocation/assembly module TamB domain-containing protein, partial [Acidobacteriota bacterium]